MFLMNIDHETNELGGTLMVDGVSRREAALRFGIHRNTIAKMLLLSIPPGYPRRERTTSQKLEVHISLIDAVL